MRLDLGCGTHCREGFEGVDAVQLEGVKHVVDLTKDTLPFEDGSVDLISSSHFLEHITDKEAIHVLEEALRVLEPGGTIELVVPNLPKLMECFLKADYGERWTWWIMTIYGNQHHEGEFHKNGWDHDKLAELLEFVGFRDIQVEEVWTHDQPCIRAEARKSHAKTN